MKKRSFEHIASGGIVKVYGVKKDNKDEGVESQESGNVIKEYTELGLYQLADHRMGAKIDLEQTVNLLRRRYQFTKKFYSGLPNLVLNTRTFIGKNKKGQPTIFDVQPKIENFSNIPSFMIDQAINKYTSKQCDPYGFTDQQRKTLAQELEYFIRRTKELIPDPENPTKVVFPDGFEDFRGTVFDLKAGNVLITSDGHLKIVDTNIYQNTTDKSFDIAKFKKAIVELELVLESLRG